MGLRLRALPPPFLPSIDCSEEAVRFRSIPVPVHTSSVLGAEAGDVIMGAEAKRDDSTIKVDEHVPVRPIINSLRESPLIRCYLLPSLSISNSIQNDRFL